MVTSHINMKISGNSMISHIENPLLVMTSQIDMKHHIFVDLGDMKLHY